MLILIGVVAGLLWGVWGACIWGLRRARGVRPELLMVTLVASAVAFIGGAELFGWPTAKSIAVSTGAASEPADLRLLSGISTGTAVVVVAVLVRSGATRRLERWSSTPR